MSTPDPHNLSKRERQVMTAIYRQGRATAMQVLRSLPDPPSYSAVRGMLRVLEEKGLLSHIQEGKRNLYIPIVNRRKAGRSALRNLVETFFAGSAEDAVTTLINMSKDELSQASFDQLKQAIENARGEGR